MTRLTAEWASGWGEFTWTHASTLTFRSPRSVESERHDLKRHLRDLARRAHRRVASFWVTETSTFTHSWMRRSSPTEL